MSDTVISDFRPTRESVFSSVWQKSDSHAFDYANPDSNPFSVRFVQPGAVPYFFEPKFIEAIQSAAPEDFHRYFIESIERGTPSAHWIGCRFFSDRFAGHSFRAQITGPHGSGKSTLMNSLRETLEYQGHSIFSWALHDRARILPGDFWRNLESFLSDISDSAAPSGNGRKNIIFLDGFEQLSLVNRVLFRTCCRSRRLGYLISTHFPVIGLPTLTRTAPSLDTLQRVVDYLLDDSKFSPAEGEIKDLYLRNRGNFRTILFDLYDRFEESFLS